MIRGLLDLFDGSGRDLPDVLSTRNMSEDSGDANGVPTLCTSPLYKLLPHLRVINSFVSKSVSCKANRGSHFVTFPQEAVRCP